MSSQDSYITFARDSSMIIAGAAIIALIVVMLASIAANCWLRNRKSQILPDSWKPSHKDDRPISLLAPALIYNRDTSLPVYRKSDTWDSYVNMIQTPDKLNDVVHSMKVHTPSSSVSSFNHFKNDINYTPSPLRKDHNNL